MGSRPSSEVDHGFETHSGQTKDKDYKIGLCCFPTSNAALRSWSKDLLAKISIICLEWRDMSTHTVVYVTLWQSN